MLKVLGRVGLVVGSALGGVAIYEAGRRIYVRRQERALEAEARKAVREEEGSIQEMIEDTLMQVGGEKLVADFHARTEAELKRTDAKIAAKKAELKAAKAKPQAPKAKKVVGVDHGTHVAIGTPKSNAAKPANKKTAKSQKETVAAAG